MPHAFSQAQQMSAGIANAVKEGKLPKSKLQGASKQMYESMKHVDSKKMASTKRKKLPYTISKEKKVYQSLKGSPPRKLTKKVKNIVKSVHKTKRY
jgi:ribonuclease HII